MQRVLKRSGLPVAYAGFQLPYLRYPLACPLSLHLRRARRSGAWTLQTRRKPGFCPVADRPQRHYARRYPCYPGGSVEMKADSIAFACYRISYPGAATRRLEQHKCMSQSAIKKT